jgi:hypothetical protein
LKDELPPFVGFCFAFLLFSRQKISSQFEWSARRLVIGLAEVRSHLQVSEQGDQGPMLWFLNISAEKIGEKVGVFDSKQS